MTLESALFGLAALASVAGALLTVLSRNAIRSAMALLLAIGGVTGLFIVLHAQFLAAIELIVYAGAIVVLFVFVIMLMGPDASPEADQHAAWSRWAGGGILAASALSTVAMLARVPRASVVELPAPRPEYGTIDLVGRELFTKGLVPFELAAVLFVAAVIGAIALARGKSHAATAAPAVDVDKPRSSTVDLATAGHDADGRKRDWDAQREAS